MIKVYTTPTCKYCKDVKAYLQEKGLEYTEIDVTSDPKHREDLIRISKGKRSVPLTVINERALLGWDREEMEKILIEEGLLKTE